jgi:hypothetical protein
MKTTFGMINPREIVEKFKACQGEEPKDIAQALSDEFGEDTIDAIAAGSDCLVRLWRGAWNAGGGDKKIKYLGAIPPETLAALYEPSNFLQSQILDSIEPVLATETVYKSRTRRRRRSARARG